MNVTALTLTPTTSPGADIEWFLSNDGGGKWHRVRPVVEFVFPDAGTDDLRCKARLHSYSHLLTPCLLKVEIDGSYLAVGMVEEVLDAVNKLRKNKQVRRHKKSKKFLNKAREHLQAALELFAADDIAGGNEQVQAAIKDLKKVKKKKSKAKKLRAQLDDFTYRMN